MPDYFQKNIDPAMNEMGSWALRDGADFLSTNAAESMNAVVKRHTKGKIFRPDVLVVKFHHLSERYFKEIVRGRYDEGDFVLAGNQRNNFQQTDEKPVLPYTRTVEQIFKDINEVIKEREKVIEFFFRVNILKLFSLS